MLSKIRKLQREVDRLKKELELEKTKCEIVAKLTRVEKRETDDLKYVTKLKHVTKIIREIPCLSKGDLVYKKDCGILLEVSKTSYFKNPSKLKPIAEIRKLNTEHSVVFSSSIVSFSISEESVDLEDLDGETCYFGEIKSKYQKAIKTIIK